MTYAPLLRRARADDAEAVLEIYAPLVIHTAISFETNPPGRVEMTGRIQSILASHEWLVAERDGTLAGYAYATAHRPRAAYRHSVEVSAYVHEGQRGRGIGRALYETLFDTLRARGFHRAFAGVALPNDPSLQLHRSTGFSTIGVFERVGYKFGTWHDVSWWQREL